MAFLGLSRQVAWMVSWGNDCMDPVVAEICLPPHGISNKDELYRPFGRLELHGFVVRLFMSGHTSHVSTRNFNKGGNVVLASDCFRGPR